MGGVDDQITADTERLGGILCGDCIRRLYARQYVRRQPDLGHRLRDRRGDRLCRRPDADQDLQQGRDLDPAKR